MGIINFLSQPWGKLSLLDVIIVVLYMLFCLYLGFRKSSSIKSIKEYAIGDGTISTFILICTLYATHLGAGMTFGSLDQIRSLGMLFAVSLFAQPIGWLIKMWVFGRNIEQFAGCISISDIMYRLYGTPGKWVTNIVSVIVSVGTLAAQASAAGYLMHYFLGMSINEGVIISIGILIIYSAVGGVKAVALTDVIQFIVFYIAIPSVCIIGLHKIGGISALIHAVPEEKLLIPLDKDNLYLLLGLIIYAATAHGTSTAFIQRFLMSNNAKQLIGALKAVAVLEFIITAVLVIMGFVLLALFPNDTSSKASFFSIIVDVLPIGLSGLVIIGLLAVIMSTADSYINATAVICTHEILKQIWPGMSMSTELLLARLSTVLIGVLSIFLALTGRSILELLWMIANFYDPIIIAPLFAGFLGMRTNSVTFIVAAVFGAGAVLISAYVYGDFSVVSFSFGVAGNIIGLLGMHYIQVYYGWIVPKASSEDVKEDVEGQDGEDIGGISSIFQAIKNFTFSDIIKIANRSILRYPPSYYSFSIWGLVYCLFPLFLLLGAGGVPNNAVNIVEILLLTFSSMCCVLLMFQDTWSNKLRSKYLGIVWYFTLTLCIPFISSYELIVRPGDIVFVIHAIVGLLLLATFADYRSFVTVATIGVFFGIFCALVSILLGMAVHVSNNGLSDGMWNILPVFCYLCIILGIIEEILKKIGMLLTLSVTDPLTKLYNRRNLTMTLDNLLEDAKAQNKEVSVSLVDVDWFGAVNKKYGHHIGDVILQELAARIKSHMRPTDVCARYGGEEFIVVMRNTDIDGAIKASERLCKAVEAEPFAQRIVETEDGHAGINITVSIGVACLEMESDNSDALIARADKALRLAKSNGKNAVGFICEGEVMEDEGWGVVP